MEARLRRTTAMSLLALLVLTSIATILPPVGADTGGRAGDHTMRSFEPSSRAQTVEAGESAEYTFILEYTGDQAGSVGLSCTNDVSSSSCTLQGPTSAGSTIQVFYTAAGDAEITLTVQTSQLNDEEEPIETTVTATSGAPPESDDAVFTTTVTGGSGGSAWSVDISADPTRRSWQSGPEVRFPITVKNTGQQQATINVNASDDRCGVLELDFVPANKQLTLAADEEDVYDIVITVPDGTQAGAFCLHLAATVTGDLTGNGTDELDIRLDIPEVEACELDLSASSATLDPGEMDEFTMTLSNTGNTDWTVRYAATPSGWVSFPDGSSGLLPFDEVDGDGWLEVKVRVQPDDSVEANRDVQVTIEGRKGSTMVCQDTLTVTVGQAHSASAQATPSTLSNVDPGTSKSTNLRVENTGNGEDTFHISAGSVPAGWSVRAEPDEVTLIGRHSTPAESRVANVQVNVSVPEGALADESIRLPITLSSGTGRVYEMTTVTVTVAAHHSMGLEVPVEQQYGKGGSSVQFPFTVTNSGNVADLFTFRDETQTASPEWSVTFTNSTGHSIVNVEIPPGATETVNVVVRIDGEEELDSNRIMVRVMNLGNGAYLEHQITAVLSDRVFSMAMQLAAPDGDEADRTAVVLPPAGRITVDMVLENTGDQGDQVDVWFEGLEHLLSVTIQVNGSVPDGSVAIERGQRMVVQVEIIVGEVVADGSGGQMRFYAASSRDRAEPSIVYVDLEVRTVHDLSLVVLGEPTQQIVYSGNAQFDIEVTNLGNVVETVTLSSSEGVRGWQVVLLDEEITLAPGTSQVVTVKVQPPFSTTIAETFEFTFSAEPEDAPRIGARHVDLTVEGEPASFLVLAPGLAATAGTLLVVALAVGLLGRRRDTA